MIEHKIYAGLSASYEKVITASDSYLSNAVMIDNLMSTPALLSTVIEASWNMLKPYIPTEYITVVTDFYLNHHEPTLVGEKVKFSLVVEKIEYDKIHVNFTGTDHIGEFCRGTLVKAIVRYDKLLEAAYKRVKM